MHFCGYFVLFNGPEKILAQYQYLASFLVLPGCQLIGFPPNCYAIDIEDIASRFNKKSFLWLLHVI